MQLLGKDPFYVLNELFRFAAHSESLFLSTLEIKIQANTEHVFVDRQQSRLSNLLYFQDILNDHQARLSENIVTIKRREHCFWPQVSDIDSTVQAMAQSAAEAFIKDFGCLHG